MRAQTRMLKVMTAALVVTALVLPAENAIAGSKVFTSFNSTATVRGSVETNANGNRDPFVLEVFALANECLKLTVTAQGTDLEMTLVGPSGRTWQDAFSNSGRPRIHAITVTRGWHVLILSHFAGAAVNADFVMTMLRTSPTNCAPITAPRILVEPQNGKSGSLGPAPQGGAND